MIKKRIPRSRTGQRFVARFGFTLIELLVVIAIIAVLVAIILPAVMYARETARRLSCKNNLKNITLAVKRYSEDHSAFPPSSTGGLTRLSYLSHVLNHLEQAVIEEHMDYYAKSYDPKNKEAHDAEVKVFRCPSGNQIETLFNEATQTTYTGKNFTHYLAVMGAKDSCSNPISTTDMYPAGYHPNGGDCSQGGYATNGVMHVMSQVRPQNFPFADGFSNTLLIGEWSAEAERRTSWIIGNSEDYNWSYSGRNIRYPINTPNSTSTPHNDLSFASHHEGGAHFSFADGRVKFLNESMDLSLLKGFASWDLGEQERHQSTKHCSRN